MSYDYSKHYNEIHSQDFTGGVIGSIQWKGTNVCIDIHCACGHHSHFDGDFMYYFECPKCKKVYAAGTNIKMIPLNDEQLTYVRATSNCIKTVDYQVEDD